jgi:hypothetical protein
MNGIALWNSLLYDEARRLIGTPYDWRWLMGFVFPPLVRGWNDEWLE